MNVERERLRRGHSREENWQRWGPYLSERQWGTVREDYSPTGTCWSYFPHDQARSRAYRWGEDGLLGWTDRECRLCLGVALWNEQDAILKERLYGLTGEEGNHGEDVKECYYYLDSSPTHSYAKALYKYPQQAFPYARLLEENRRRGKEDPEFELEDTGIFDDGAYFDVTAEYAKRRPNDILCRLTIANRSKSPARLHVLPMVWFRNTWSWGCTHEGCWLRPRLKLAGDGEVSATHESLGDFRWYADTGPDGSEPELIFTENETNSERLFRTAQWTPYVKDGFNRYVVEGERGAVNPAHHGTRAAARYVLRLEPGESVVLRVRLTSADELPDRPFGPAFDRMIAQRRRECDAFYRELLPAKTSDESRLIARQAYAGLLWSKQFYHYIVRNWLDGDPDQPAPPASRLQGRNHDWRHLFNRDVILMPDTWEYPWYAAWDLAFHVVALAPVDPEFCKQQLLLFLREWYMHPNGQLPAYEFAFGDVNPPVHAWACLEVYRQEAAAGRPDRDFLARCFHKLMINFTWWVNRKDANGDNLFSGGFLGLDNIGVFDRSKPLPGGGRLEQADGTAWMAFYCGNMLSMALELARHDRAYEDVASKFFEHFVAIVDAMNDLGGDGLWNDDSGFYLDELKVDGRRVPLQVFSMVGIIPLFAVEVLESEVIRDLPGFLKRMDWFLEHRGDLARHITYCQGGLGADGGLHYLLAVPSRERLERVLKRVLSEDEFLSPFGIRSLSKGHRDEPFVFDFDGERYDVGYTPGESVSHLFGGNSNWRGPVWFPVNYLLIHALERYHHYYGDSLKVECPTGSGKQMNLGQVAAELRRRLALPFQADKHGHRPCFGDAARYATDPHWRDLLLYREYFHGDTGKGLGASHQTGWTALVANCLR